jgi:hypothetical protein
MTQNRKHLTRAKLISDIPVLQTRYPALLMQRQGIGNWRILDASTEKAVGPQYASKAELWADLDRFAEVFGAK